LSNIQLEFEGGGPFQEAGKKVPELPEEYPEATMFGVLPAYGFYCRHVDGLSINGLTVQTASSEQRPALIFDDVRDLKLTGFRGQPPKGELALIRFRDVQDAFLNGNVAPDGTNVFLQLEGSSQGVSVIGNDLSRAGKAFHFESPAGPGALNESANRLP
jgi:hypothetical protein